MTMETGPSPSPAPGAWPVLDLVERRVLGVLVEKQKTSKSADTYPLTLNALTGGCNQKSNRDPILDLDDDAVESAVLRCVKKNLAARVTGARVERWKHLLYENWQVDKVELAILAELLLRGPQTEGELRTRVSRMEPVEDLDGLRASLKPLVERKLVIYLTPEERRGAVLTHGFHNPDELQRLRARASAAAVAADEPHSGHPAAAALAPELARLEADIAAVREDVAGLKKSLTELQNQLRSLQEALGE
jgi:uncharacterized protein YceH (UPF0502 family)